MSFPLTVNGQTFNLPSVGENGWGASVNAFFSALASGTVQLNGGVQPLTATLDFGPDFGLVVVDLQTGTFTATTVSTGTLTATTVSTGTVAATGTVSSATVLHAPTTSTNSIQGAGAALGISANASPTKKVLVDPSDNVGFGVPVATNTVSISANGVPTTPMAFDSSHTSATSTMFAVTGDINAQGGFRQCLGPFTLNDSIANNTTFTCNFTAIGSIGTTPVAATLPMPFSGSVVGVSLVSALASTNVFLQVNGLGIALTATGTSAVATAAKDVYPFTAGQTIQVFVKQTTGGAANPKAVVYLWIEC